MAWTRVTDHAEMIAWSKLKFDFCPYPLELGLERFQTGRQERHATLVHYGHQPVTRDRVAWFDLCNGRQTIDTGQWGVGRIANPPHFPPRTL